MAVIYNQALAHRFGVALVESLESGEWTSFDVAVAWVRRSGTRHLVPALRGFLDGGRVVRMIVGIDIENTSKEGLEDLLSLISAGDCKTFVYHNEASPVFHPKVYLFSNDKKARLIVGSNNITEAGLFTNTEMGLQVDVSVNDPVITDVKSALDSWQDESEGLARVLNEALLTELVDEGYVALEKTLRKRRRDSENAKKGGAGKGTRKRLFGAKAFSAPIPPEGATKLEESAEPAAAIRGGMRIGGALSVRGYRHPLMITNVLLMRVRPARGTQVQIPIPLRQSEFFDGADSITSGRDGETRPISATHPERAAGAVNTYKVEMPETAGMSDPVVRLDRTDQGIKYYVYDADSTQGRPIMESLEEGRGTDPPTTILTKPNDPEHCTWYRFV